MDSPFLVKLAGKKYDIKKFLCEHPGGAKVLMSYRDKSVGEVMSKYEHSNSAYHLLEDFRSYGGVANGLSESGRIITKQEENRDVKEIAFLEQLENKLDWSKPILCQLPAIAPHYEQWVNAAVYKDCRLFESPILEFFTYTWWHCVLLFWVPVIGYLGYTQLEEHVLCGDQCTKQNISFLKFLYHIIYGVLIWTLLEYSLHRWIFHLKPGRSITLMKFHFLVHGVHHKVPFDRLRQVFPPVAGFLIACLISVPIIHIFDYPFIKIEGGAIGYLAYDMIHYYVHHGSPKYGTYLYEMKRYHSNHHFINQDKAFGISSNIWDHVFRTFVKVRKLGINLQWQCET